MTIEQWSDYLWIYARWFFLLLVPTVAWLVARSLDKEARLRVLEARDQAKTRTIVELVTKEESRDAARDQARDVARDGPRDEKRDEARDRGERPEDGP
jgi:hypothetical protein